MRSNWANNYILADLKVYGQFDFKRVLLQRKPNRSDLFMMKVVIIQKSLAMKATDHLPSALVTRL